MPTSMFHSKKQQQISTNKPIQILPTLLSFSQLLTNHSNVLRLHFVCCV